MWGSLTTTLLQELRRSAQFAPLLTGVKTQSPSGDEVAYKVTHLGIQKRPRGYHFLPWSFRCRAEANGVSSFGYGEATTPLTAIYKSIAEAIERTTFKLALKTPMATATSNGWAAHANIDEFKRHALLEKVERDAVLVHWLTETPLLHIEVSTLPSLHRNWMKRVLPLADRYKNLKVLITTEGYLPTVVVVLHDEHGYGLIAHATSPKLESALNSSIDQACRLAHELRFRTFRESSFQLSKGTEERDFKYSPEDHAALYAEHIPLPSWMFGESIPFSKSVSQWKERYQNFRSENLDPKYSIYRVGPLFVGCVTTNELQDLYFGPTRTAYQSGLIHQRCLEKVSSLEELNWSPHAVA